MKGIAHDIARLLAARLRQTGLFGRDILKINTSQQFKFCRILTSQSTKIDMASV
jgi:hypothetical protein